MHIHITKLPPLRKFAIHIADNTENERLIISTDGDREAYLENSTGNREKWRKPKEGEKPVLRCDGHGFVFEKMLYGEGVAA